jgi:hypothetical protein
VHIRNALSHPTVKTTNPPTTGYTSVEDGSGRVVRMRFTDSPDLTGKGYVRPEADAQARTGGDPLNVRVFTIELPSAVSRRSRRRWPSSWPGQP